LHPPVTHQYVTPGEGVYPVTLAVFCYIE